MEVPSDFELPNPRPYAETNRFIRGRSVASEPAMIPVAGSTQDQMEISCAFAKNFNVGIDMSLMYLILSAEAMAPKLARTRINMTVIFSLRAMLALFIIGMGNIANKRSVSVEIDACV